ncbi:MAG: DUF2460 domain-containing protein, partial [Alphaproteobacteria bacterium]
KSCAPSQAPTALDQTITDVDSATFQLVKTYGAGDSAYERPIAKPVMGSVRVAVGGAELDADSFAVDTTTGIVTLDVAPGGAVTAGFLFDTPVRFDVDRLDLSLDGFGAGRALAVPLIEILI